MTSFFTSRNTIDAPGTCSNRKASSYSGVSDFEDWWTYSDSPSDADQIGQADAFLAYPEPTDFWTVSMEGSCTPINYYAKFSWNDLMSCEDADGRELIDV